MARFWLPWQPEKKSYWKPLDRFQYNLTEMFLCGPSSKIVRAIFLAKNMATRALYPPVYLYRKFIVLSETAGLISI